MGLLLKAIRLILQTSVCLLYLLTLVLILKRERERRRGREREIVYLNRRLVEEWSLKVKKMKRLRLWGGFKRSFLFPTKLFFLRVNSSLLHKPKGNGNGLLNLYKDIESCGEYRDIQVMWDMIQSCPPHTVHENTTSIFRLGFSSTWRSLCFEPT